MRAVALPAQLAATPSPGARLGTGTVQSWDTGQGFQVAVAGAVLAVDVTLASATGISPGDTVAVLWSSSTVLILGRTVEPDSHEGL